MKRVIFIINTMGCAGAEKSMIELMKYYDKKQYELHLLSLINRGEMYDQVPAHVIIHNKRIDNRPFHSSRGFLIRIVLKTIFHKLAVLHNLPMLYAVLKEQVKARRIQYDKLLWKLISDAAPLIDNTFDIAIAYLEGGATYYLADHVKATKKAAFLHIDYKLAGYTPLQDHGCYEGMDQIFVVSEDAKKSFLEVYPQFEYKTRLFHNLINKEEILAKARSGEGFTDDFKGVRLVTIARLHYQKAIDHAIAALAELKKQNYPVRWYVIGDGGLRQELSRLVSEYRLNEDFIFLGAKANPYPYLMQCDLYVHVTRFEGKSIAIQEAQALGKAIIVSDCSGNREQISNGKNGLIVDLELDSIVNGIKRLINDHELRKQMEEENRNTAFDFIGGTDYMQLIERSAK